MKIDSKHVICYSVYHPEWYGFSIRHKMIDIDNSKKRWLSFTVGCNTLSIGYKVYGRSHKINR